MGLGAGVVVAVSACVRKDHSIPWLQQLPFVAIL